MALALFNARLQTDYFPVSGKFVTNEMQTGYDRLNSDRRDVRYNGRFGWTPRENGERALFHTGRLLQVYIPGQELIQSICIPGFQVGQSFK